MKYLIVLLILCTSSPAFSQIEWQKAGLDTLQIWDLSINAYDNSLYAATNHGVFKTTDDGQSWNALDGPFKDSMTLSVAVDNNYILVGTHDSLLYYSINKGGSWIHPDHLKGHNEDVWQATLHRNSSYFSRSGKVLFTSPDKGSNWNILDSAGDQYFVCQWFAFDSIGNIYSGGLCDCGLWKSFDSGKTFFRDSFFLNTTITDIQVDAKNRVYVVADHSQGGIFYSDDHGLTWQMVDSARVKMLSAIKISFNQQGWIFATSGFGTGGVYISTDNGKNWTMSNNGLPDTNTNTWSICVNKDSEVFVGTMGNGVYRSKSVGSSVDFEKKYVLLSEVYPNPTDLKITFSLTLPKEAFTSIKIYNPLGKEAATLVNKRLAAGDQRIEFDASHLPSGIYYYRFQAGEYVETKPIIVVH